MNIYMQFEYKFNNKKINFQFNKNRANNINIFYDRNNEVKIFTSLIINESNINKDGNLVVFYKENLYNKKKNNKTDKEIRLSRQIDRTIRPFLSNLNIDICLNMILLESQINEDYLNDILLNVFTIFYISGFKNLMKNLYGENFFSNKSNNILIKKNFNLLITGNNEGIVMMEGYFNKLTTEELNLIITELLNKKNIYDEYYQELSNQVKEEFVLYNKPIINTKSNLKTPAFKRIDGRQYLEIRPIEVQLNPLNINSCFFQRGETKVLVITNINEMEYNEFILQYKFHPFAVGEFGETFGNSRREKGHSFLAQNSFKYIGYKGLNYDIISEVLQCDGSSSMATVCGASICLNNYFNTPLISGITVGLIQNKIVVDLRGQEDNIGDCDLKLVSNENKEILSVFMDTKKTISVENLSKLITIALKSNIEIIKKMNSFIKQDSIYKETISIKKEKISYLIQKNHINFLQKTFDSSIKCFNNGLIIIQSTNKNYFKILKEIIKSYDSLLHDKKITCIIHHIKINEENKQITVNLGVFNYILNDTEFKYKVGDIITGLIDNQNNTSNKIVLNKIKKINFK